ncbi:MAG: response regulator [Myxococcota bacterium]|nr:response regulator [Myxococcota bacterium]
MGKKLLLADDSVTIQKVVGISFASEDVELLIVDNGNDAVERTRAIRPDVVLADVVMPGLNGYEVCEALQADPDLRHIPVLLLTGTFESFDEKRAARCGAAGHVAKPFEAQALVDRVRALLARLPEHAPADSTLPPLANPSEIAPSNADAFDFFEDGMATAEPTSTRSPDSSPGADVFSFGDAGTLEAPPADPASNQEAATLDETLAPALTATQFDSDFTTGAFESDLTTGATNANSANDPAQETILDPRGASGFDVSSSDLAGPFTAPDSEELAGPFTAPDSDELAGPFTAPDSEELAGPFTAPDSDELAGPFTAPDSDELAGPFTTLAAEPLGLDPDEPLFTIGADEPVAAAGGESAFGSRAPATPPAEAEIAFEVFTPGAEPTAETELVVEPEPIAATDDASALAATALAEVSPRLRESLHDTLEKIAWESLGDLSDQIVRQAVARVEQIAWEVIPQLTETLIREEIRRMKGGTDD